MSRGQWMRIESKPQASQLVRLYPASHHIAKRVAREHGVPISKVVANAIEQTYIKDNSNIPPSSNL